MRRGLIGLGVWLSALVLFAAAMSGCASTLSLLGQSRLEEARTVLHQVWQAEGDGRPEPAVRSAQLGSHVVGTWQPQTNEILLSPMWLQMDGVPIRPGDSDQTKEYKRVMDWTIPFSHESGHALLGHTTTRCKTDTSACEHQADMRGVSVLQRGWGLSRDAAEFKACVWLMVNARVLRSEPTSSGGHSSAREFYEFRKDTGRGDDCYKPEAAR